MMRGDMPASACSAVGDAVTLCAVLVCVPAFVIYRVCVVHTSSGKDASHACIRSVSFSSTAAVHLFVPLLMMVLGDSCVTNAWHACAW